MKEQLAAWCEQYCGFEPRELSPEESKFVISVLMAERAKKPIPPDFKEEFLYKVVEKRAEFVGLRLTEHAVMFLSALCETPGEAVMAVYALRHRHGTELVTVFQLCGGLYAMGVPSAEESSRLWDAQKVDGVNLLDKVNPAEVF